MVAVTASAVERQGIVARPSRRTLAMASTTMPKPTIVTTCQRVVVRRCMVNVDQRHLDGDEAELDGASTRCAGSRP